MDTTMQNVRLDEMRGADVYDRNGDKIGSVEEIYYDTQSNQPEWIGIGTGFFGTKRVLVPVQGASMERDGVSVPYDKDMVKGSPDIDEDEIQSATERELHSYYGTEGQHGDGHHHGHGAEASGRDRSGEASVTRSEEELQVGTRSAQAGSVRLRKWVETEPVALDVELKRETARVVREDVNEPVGEHDFEEQEVEVPLHAERPVVQKETVAKERVGVEKSVETKTETVEDELRKERVEVEGDDVQGGSR